jgi:NAD(P)-dependent dehydrogenase (short-subunit alcohol dehydrogenase family)
MDVSTGVGSCVLVVGGSGGLGLELVRAFSAVAGQDSGAKVVATCRKRSDPDLDEAASSVIEGIDVSMDGVGDKLCSAIRDLGWSKVDSLVVVAGIFTVDSLEDIQTERALTMYNVVALGPLRIVAALLKQGLLTKGGKLALITSEGGSIGLRTVDEGGGNYG